MPINDVVSPVIQAFLAGRNEKRAREKDVIQAQQEADESKLRQQRAQLLQREIDNWDKVNDSQMSANFINNKTRLVKAVQDGIIPVKAVEEFSAALNGQVPNVPGGIGIASTIKHMAEVDGKQVEVPTPDDITAQQVKNARAFNEPKLELALAQQGIKDTSAIKLQNNQFTQQDKMREDTQTFQTDQNEKNRLQQEKLSIQRTAAQTALAKYQAEESMRRTMVHEGGANARTAASIAAKHNVVTNNVDDILKTSVESGLITRQGLSALGPDMSRVVQAKAILNNYKILSDTQEKEIQAVGQLTGVIEKMDRISKAIGNGSIGGYIFGTELKRDYESLEAELGGLVNAHGNKGAQSDRDIVRAAGLLPARAGMNTAKTNEQRIKDAKEWQVRILNHYYPKGTNAKQRLKMAEKFGIDPTMLADKDK